MGAGVKREITMRIPLLSEELAKAALVALAPEAERPPTDRFSVSLELQGRVLVLKVIARDTASLRAAVNAYMSWVKALRDACLTVSRF